MENNYFNLNPMPAVAEHGLAVLVLDIRNFIDLIKSQAAQQERLPDNLDYLLAISG